MDDDKSTSDPCSPAAYDSEPESEISSTSDKTVTSTKTLTGSAESTGTRVSLSGISIASSASAESSFSTHSSGSRSRGSSCSTSATASNSNISEASIVEKNVVGDEDYRAHLTNQGNSAARGTHYGEQLSDDILNTFVDKIQTIAPEVIEGCLAVQAVQLIPDEIPKLIPGKHRSLQIILDSFRKHFILAEWIPSEKNRGVGIYDSLAKKCDDFESILNNSCKSQFKRLYGHLYSDDNLMKFRFETFQDGQNDNWSCGLRTAALFTVKVFYRKPFRVGDASFNLRIFNDILHVVIESKQPITEKDLRIDDWFKLLPRRPLHYVIFSMNFDSGEILPIKQNFQTNWNSYDEGDLECVPAVDAESAITNVLQKLTLKDEEENVPVDAVEAKTTSDSDCPSERNNNEE